MIDMSNDSQHFRTLPELEGDGWVLAGNAFRKQDAGRVRERLPLYEAKMVHHFDHRWATWENGRTRTLTVAEKQDPHCTVMPRYWVDAREVRLRSADLPTELLRALRRGSSSREIAALLASAPRSRNGVSRVRATNGLLDGEGAVAFAEKLLERRSPRWLMGWRDICRSTDERTLIGGMVPRAGVGDKFLLIRPEEPSSKAVGGQAAAALLGSINSLACDFVARQKIGGTSLKYFTMRQIAVLPRNRYYGAGGATAAFIAAAVLELTYTAWDLQPFAQDCGWDGPPFRWDEARRFLLRAELDAAFFHLYLPATREGAWRPARTADGGRVDETAEELATLQGHFATPRDAVDYILDTFPIVRRKDEERHGEYRTKRVILEIYDAMQEAASSGARYATRLDPPPADPRCCHPPREEFA